ncbi:unnamed protein product [Vitrella brassicaformis CCMP3155]|uniref:Uncharacterized protein n=1 Tax=Vitrella brassicaformis (strain CCMP3155) TaxID=1169540 RepID=A0A0G4E8M3_VITBC|nr:unnamed protein product [Vitrella brassicaformis CCMP3155]|eukprot:CEL91707.1 unnamed protein product [Vitrella brassicaformis CCMP3155]
MTRLAARLHPHCRESVTTGKSAMRKLTDRRDDARPSVRPRWSAAGPLPAARRVSTRAPPATIGACRVTEQSGGLVDRPILSSSSHFIEGATKTRQL